MRLRTVYIKWLLILILASALILSGCVPGTDSVTEEAKETEELTETATESAGGTIESAEMGPTPQDTERNPLPPEPVAHIFQTSDGVELQGMFYPSRMDDQPLIVLMHWAKGNLRDWRVIAPWLQNSDISEDSVGSGMPWLMGSWFPPMPEGVSFNVFAFTFRGCENGCQSIDPEGWLLDIEAAMMYIREFENVDLSRVATIGASIGADGAAYGCYYYNAEYGVCHGAMSISPGGYLTISYPNAVANLEGESPPASAWCLYADGDAPAAESCRNAQGDLYQPTEYEGEAHGMALLSPDFEPNPLSKFLEFFNCIGICDACFLE